MQLGAGADQDQVGLPRGRVAQDVGAALDRVVGHGVGVQHGQALAAEREGHRRVGLVEREAPCQGGLVRTRRADHVQVRGGAQMRELLDRLVRRAVLAQPDRIVGEHDDRRQVHDRRQPHRPLHVVGEVEEGGAERAQAVQVEPVHHRAHAVLAHAVVDVARVEVVAADRAAVVDQRERRGLQVRRAADQVRHPGGRPLDHLARGLARGHRRRPRDRSAAARPPSRRACGPRSTSDSSSHGSACSER